VRRALRGLKYPFRGNTASVYVCATRRRKPGVCPNSLVLPMADTDETVLSMVEGEVLSPRWIEELVAMVDRSDGDDTSRLAAGRDDSVQRSRGWSDRSL
jgi:hypothetical protein